MLNEKWSFAGIDLNIKNKWGIEEVLEGLGRPGLRGNNLQVPFQDGSRWIKKRFDTRKITFSMWIRGRNRAELDENIDEFLKSVGKKGQHSLKRTKRNGEAIMASAEIYSQISFIRKNPGYSKFALEFEMADPFFYSLNKTAELKTVVSNEFSWQHLNPGSAMASKMRIILSGPLSNPVLQNTDNGIWIQYLGSIGSGESVIFDTEKFTCKQGETNMISVIKHGGDACWMILESGNNSMKLKSDITGGSIEIQYYPPYF